jgi:exodeoxyribonuclease VII large subunit
MLNILARRAPWVRVVISPVRVQGQGAALEIARALTELNDLVARGVLPLDVIVVSRGGGSIEDLWEFNEEIVARAIVQSTVPVVSAVGHEIDFTIADFAADLRAATPSAAAELIVPDGEELRRVIAVTRSRLQRAAGGILLRERNRLAYLSRAASPQTLMRSLREWEQRVDSAGETLRRGIREHRLVAERQLVDLRARLRQHRPDQQLSLCLHRLAAVKAQLNSCARARLIGHQQRFARAVGLLKMLSPEATLARGYSVTTTSDGTILRSATGVRSGSRIATKLSDGSINSVVE